MIKSPYPVLAAMERDGNYPTAKYHHLQPNPRFSDRTISNSITSSISTISAFSDCNSDRSTDFYPPYASSPSRSPSSSPNNNGPSSSSSTTPHRHHRLVPAYSDERVRALVSDLDSEDPEAQRTAVTELRFLAKDNPENRLKIARAGAVLPLVGLLSSTDPDLLEQAVTAVLNLSICEENKNLFARAGAIRPLVSALRPGSGTGPACRENAACALVRLSMVEENRAAIGRAGAMPYLVQMVEKAGVRGKKDALTAIYALCASATTSSSSSTSNSNSSNGLSSSSYPSPSCSKENRVRAARAGVVRPLLELMANPESGMVDKAAYVLVTIAGIPEATKDIVQDSGVPVLVELIESGSPKQKEAATDILLQVCQESVEGRVLAVKESAVPALVALKESGTPKARKRAELLVELLRQPRPTANGVSVEGSRRTRESDKAAASSTRNGAGGGSSSRWGDPSYSF